jgi:hypothetical protein
LKLTCFLNSIWLKTGVLSVLCLFAKSEGRATGFISQNQTAKAASCDAPQYRQYDFRLGDWDVFDIDNPNTKVARAHIDRILDGCVVRENYEQADGMNGQSFSIYDVSRGVWHQSWVTNGGVLLMIEGYLRAGAMVLSGVDHAANGGERRVRGTWKPMEGGVRETAVRSTDGGKTWVPWFDIAFRPHKQ